MAEGPGVKFIPVDGVKVGFQTGTGVANIEPKNVSWKTAAPPN